MIINFEGADGSGKSTLLNYIDNKLCNIGIYSENANEFIHTKPNAEDRITEHEMFKRLKKMATSKTIYLLDREPISDVIYRVFDDKDPVTSSKKLGDFLSRLPLHSYIIVYCNSSAPDKYDRMIKRGEDNPVALNRYKELNRLYSTVMGFIETGCLSSDVLHFDYYKKNSKEKILSELKDRILYHSL